MRAHVDQAWVHFYAGYWNWLVHLALGMGVCRQDAEDLAQKTFIALAKNISRFIYEPARGRFSGWLAKVLKNNVINFRKRGAQNEQATQPDQFDGFVGLENHFISELMAKDLRQLIEQSYRELEAQVSVKQWQIFALYNLQERPVEEIATQFNLKSGSVSCIKSRMLQKLAVILRRKMQIAYGDDVFGEQWNKLGNQSEH